MMNDRECYDYYDESSASGIQDQPPSQVGRRFPNDHDSDGDDSDGNGDGDDDEGTLVKQG